MDSRVTTGNQVHSGLHCGGVTSADGKSQLFQEAIA